MAKGRTLGGIFVDLILRDEKFRARMKSAAGVVAVQTARMRKGLNSVASSNITKFTALLGGAGLAGAIYKSVNAIDRLAKQSDRLGIPTEKLAAFRHAAGLAGVEVETMEKSLAKMSRNVFEASTGNEGLANTFEKLGLNVSELMRMAPDKQYNLITDAINKLGNANERAAVAQEIFGKGGLELMSMISGGSAALKDAAKEAELFGLALNRVDAAKVEAANDAMGRLQAAGEGLFQQLAVRFSPLISELGERVVKLIEKMGGMGKVSETVFNSMIKGASKVGDVFRGWELIFAGVKLAFKSVETSVVFIVGSIMTQIQTILNGGVTVINQFIKAYNNLPIKQKAQELDKFTFAGIDATIAATKNAVKELGEAKDDFWRVVDKGLVSDTLPVLVGEIGEKWAKVAEETAGASQAAQTFEYITVTAADKAEKKVKSTTAAVKELKGEFMSFADIATKGLNSFNAKLARQAVALREKADTAEAKGQFSLADSLRGRAEGVESRVKRRELDDTGKEITAAERAANAAAVVESKRTKAGTPETPGEAYKPKTRAEADAMGPGEDQGNSDRDTPAKRLAIDQAERDEKWANFDARLKAQKENLTVGSANMNAPTANEESGEASTVAEQQTKSSTQSGEGGSLTEKLNLLIDLLIGLPKQLGVA